MVDMSAIDACLFIVFIKTTETRGGGVNKRGGVVNKEKCKK